MIRGNRLLFRPIESGEIGDRYLEWMNDPDVVKFLEIKYPQGSEHLNVYWKAHILKKDEPWLGIYIYDDNHADEYIGNIKLGPINWIHRRADISLFIGRKNMWGKGYGTEAISLMTAYAFKTLNLHKVTAGIYSQNIGSKKAFEKAGFKVEAILNGHVWTEKGYDDLLLLARMNELSKQPLYGTMELSE